MRLLIVASTGALTFNLTVANAITAGISKAWQTESGTLRHGDIGQDPFYDYLIEKFIPRDLPELKDSLLAYEGVIRCFQSKPGDKFDIAVLGDSHAEAYFVGIAQNLPNRNVLYVITDPSSHISDGRKIKQIYDWLLVRKDIRYVLMNGFWQRKVLTEKVLNEDLQSLRAPNRHIILTSDVPDFPFDASVCKYRLSITNNSSICQIQDTDEEVQNLENDFLLNQAVERFPLTDFVDTYSLFCSGKTCQMILDEDLLFRDSNHLNVLGSKVIGQFIVENSSLTKLISANHELKNSVD